MNEHVVMGALVAARDYFRARENEALTGAFGMGVYSYRDPDAEDVLAQLDAAIAAMGGEP